MNHDDPTLPLPSSAGPSPGPYAAAPREIGPYRVISLLGEGGFGSVYLAEQSEPVARRVALKILKPGMDSRAVVARFEAERQALALMDHPGVAKVFDAGLTPQHRPYFVMELVRGDPITVYCDRARLGVEERVRLMIAVCAAVQHAHFKGVVHRDLKPSNILVESSEAGPAVKVIDFGVAKALHHPLTDRPAYTEVGQLIGTPEYMSPEQARGATLDIDTRTDVYSLGAVLYELLTGETPLKSERLREAGYAGVGRVIEETLPERPSERLTHRTRAGSTVGGAGPAEPETVSKLLRGDLDWIVMKALEKDRERRYPSASELAADLRRYLADEPVSAGPPSVTYRARKFIRRNRGAVVGASAALLALVLGIAGTSTGLAWALRERARAEQQASAATHSRDEAEAVTGFLSDMLEAVNPEEQGKDVTVRAVLDRAGGTLRERFRDRPQVEARLQQTIGNAYRGLGMFASADEHLPRSVELRERSLGPDNVETINALGNLGGLRLQQGRYEEAERLLRDALARARRAGASPEKVLGLKNNLAITLERQKKTAEAEALQTEVLEEQVRDLGPTHEHTLGSMLNLANHRARAGKIAEAEALLQRAGEGWRTAHGPEHPGAVLAMHELGMFYWRTGRLAQAEPLLRQVVEVRERRLGEKHPETARARANFGLVLSGLERNDEAEAVLLRAAGDAEAALGPVHDDTRQIYSQLLGHYEKLGWPDRGRAAVQRAVEHFRLVADYPGATALDLNDAAWYLLKVEPAELRDTAAGLRAASRACELERAAGGPDLWMYLDTLGIAQQANGQSKEAAATQREAIKLIPPGGEQHRKELEERLAEYERAGK